MSLHSFSEHIIKIIDRKQPVICSKTWKLTPLGTLWWWWDSACYILQVKFTATINAYVGSIALDDIRIVDGACPHIGSCDFEYDMCGYFNPIGIDVFDWLRNSGASSTTETGPPVDHTTNTDQGEFLIARLLFMVFILLNIVWFCVKAFETQTVNKTCYTLIPQLTGHPSYPYLLIGALFFFIILALFGNQEKDSAMARLTCMIFYHITTECWLIYKNMGVRTMSPSSEGPPTICSLLEGPFF